MTIFIVDWPIKIIFRDGDFFTIRSLGSITSGVTLDVFQAGRSSEPGSFFATRPHENAGARPRSMTGFWKACINATISHLKDIQRSQKKSKKYIYFALHEIWGWLYGAWKSHGATPGYHPFLDGIFHELNHPAVGYPHDYGSPDDYLPQKSS